VAKDAYAGGDNRQTGVVKQNIVISHQHVATRIILTLLVLCDLVLAADPKDARSKGDASETSLTAAQQALVQAVASSKVLKVENLTRPLTSVRFDAPLLVPNLDGRSYDVLLTYYKSYRGPAVACIFDLGSGKQRQVDIPEVHNVHLMGHEIGSDRRLYWALQSDVGLDLWVYDPRENSLSPKQIINAGYYGQTNRMTTGTDGGIYGTVGHRGEQKAGIYQIDPATGHLTDYGPVGPAVRGSPYAMGIAADNRYVYVAYGKTPWRLLAYDRKTGQARELLSVPSQGGIGVQQLAKGCAASATTGKGLDAKRTEYWLHGGKAIPKGETDDRPPWGGSADPPPRVAPSLPKPIFDLAEADPTTNPDGSAVFRYRFTQTEQWKDLRFKPPTYGATITSLFALPDGRIFGGNMDRGGFFLYDPRTDRTTYLGRIALAHHCTALLDGRLYLAGYPGGILWEYDLNRPWTATYAEDKSKGTARRGSARKREPEENPRFLCQLRDYCGIHRAVSAATGADGRVYFGGAWYRDGKGGGFAWWDPRRGQGDGFWKELSTYQVAHMTATADAGYIVISTMVVPDLVLNKPTPKQAKLFVFDTNQRRVAREIEPVASAVSTGLVAPGQGDRIVGMTRDPADESHFLLYGVDIGSGTVVYRKRIAAPPISKNISQPVAQHCGFQRGPDGCVWLLHMGRLARINPDDGSFEIVGKLVDSGSDDGKQERLLGTMAFSGPDIYISGSEHLRRIRAPVPSLRRAPQWSGRGQRSHMLPSDAGRLSSAWAS